MPTYQYVIDEYECQLYNDLRALETEHATEVPLILNGTHSKLDKTFKLIFELDGRKIVTLDVAGTRLLAGCASASVQVVQQVLSSEEPVVSHDRLLETNSASENSKNDHPDVIAPDNAAVSSAEEALEPASVATPVSWDVAMQAVIPPYVKTVSFVVPLSELNLERQKYLRARFPDVRICSSLEVCDEHNETGAELTAVQRSRQNLTPDTMSISSMISSTDSPLTEICASIASESTPARSRLSSSRNSTDPLDVTPRSSKESDAEISRAAKLSTTSIDSFARHLGLESFVSGMTRKMWSYWQKEQGVMPFTTARMQGCELEQFYQGLVAMYIFAHHKNDKDLCFAALLAFQGTNYGHVKLLDIGTALLAFKFLPEDDDLCRWIATLLSFLWKTRQYRDYQTLLATFPQADKDALSRFLFAIAYTRDPFTKGLNTAVLDRWCEVHHHQEGGAEAASCRKAYDKLKDKLENIRRKEAEDDYAEAKNVVDKYEGNLRSKEEGIYETKKRKSESPNVQPKKEQRRGSRRSGVGQAP